MGGKEGIKTGGEGAGTVGRRGARAGRGGSACRLSWAVSIGGVARLGLGHMAEAKEAVQGIGASLRIAAADQEVGGRSPS